MPEKAETINTVNELNVLYRQGYALKGYELRDKSCLEECVEEDLANFIVASVAAQPDNRCIFRHHAKLIHLQQEGVLSRLVLHMRMTGSLIINMDEKIYNSRHCRLNLLYANQKGEPFKVSFIDPRRFGKVYITDWTWNKWLIEHNISPIDICGSEHIHAASNEWSEYAEHHPNRKVKDLLLDQTVVSGIGNYMACEGLFRTGIHPETRLRNLTSEEWSQLELELNNIVSEMILNKGVTLRDYKTPSGEIGTGQNVLQVYGREGKQCVRCGNPIIKVKVSGRGTFFCKNCQPRRQGD